MKQDITDLRQSPEWGKFLESLGWEVDEYQTPTGRCQILIRKIPFLGSIIKIQRPAVIDFKRVEELSKKHRALFVKLEPRSKITEGSGFKRDSWPLLPTRTILINLTKNEEQLLKEMKKDNRYCIRRSEQEDLQISSQPLSENGASLKEFYKILKKTGGRGKFWVPPLKHLEAKARAFGFKGWLISISLENRGGMLAGALILTHKNTAFYHHAASSKEGQKIYAPYAVMWETIKLTKEEGFKVLDLEGIYDPRYPKLTKNWRGFTHFKKGFGGEIITFPESYTKHYNIFTKLLFK